MAYLRDFKSALVAFLPDTFALLESPFLLDFSFFSSFSFSFSIRELPIGAPDFPSLLASFPSFKGRATTTGPVEGPADGAVGAAKFCCSLETVLVLLLVAIAKPFALAEDPDAPAVGGAGVAAAATPEVAVAVEEVVGAFTTDVMSRRGGMRSFILSSALASSNETILPGTMSHRAIERDNIGI